MLAKNFFRIFRLNIYEIEVKMIHRVNKLVMFKNSFTRTGRLANREIKKLLSMSDSGDIYQKNLPNGKIALQQDQKLKSLRKSMTLILNKYGIQNKILPFLFIH